jgi:hypothetical protein
MVANGLQKPVDSILARDQGLLGWSSPPTGCKISRHTFQKAVAGRHRGSSAARRTRPPFRLAERGAETLNQAFKWGLGPYRDGLSAQGNVGVVTQMTIALARRPERVEAFFVGVAQDGGLEAAVLAVRGILRTLGGTVGAINLMNSRRVLAMTVPYPADRAGSGGVLPQEVVLDLARRHQVRAWTGIGALYGDPKVVKAARQVVQRFLRPVADRIVFITPERSAFVGRLIGRLIRSVPALSRIAKLLGVADIARASSDGRPVSGSDGWSAVRSGTPPRLLANGKATARRRVKSCPRWGRPDLVFSARAHETGHGQKLHRNGE